MRQRAMEWDDVSKQAETRPGHSPKNSSSSIMEDLSDETQAFHRYCKHDLQFFHDLSCQSCRQDGNPSGMYPKTGLYKGVRKSVEMSRWKWNSFRNAFPSLSPKRIWQCDGLQHYICCFYYRILAGNSRDESRSPLCKQSTLHSPS
jgi:hypothetical protein